MITFKNIRAQINWKKSIPYWPLLMPLLSIAFVTNRTGVTPLLSYLILATLLILSNKLFSNKRHFIVFNTASALVFSTFCFLDFSYAYLFNERITLSTIYIIIASNGNETGDFLSMYLKSELIAIGLLFVGGIIICSLLLKKHLYILRSKNTSPKLIIPILIIGIAALIYKGHFFPKTATEGLLSYSQEIDKINNISISSHGNFELRDLPRSWEDEEEIYVLIIGESTTRHHMGLYGYPRNTTPLLSSRTDDLFVYNQVISPNTHTIPVLDKMLTLEQNDDPAIKYNQTISQLFNSAGFSTYWLSNQAEMGLFETPTRRLSKTSQHDYFTDGSTLDEVLLPQLDQALKGESKHKFIVLHLMGNHFMYSKRYPESFEHFESIPHTIFPSAANQRMINEYDNAVLYNDHIVNEVIEKVNAQNARSFVLYLSDHGEDVYETINEACHVESQGTKPMFDIPFIIWMSEPYQTQRPDLVVKTDRKYSSADLFHTITDLASIPFSRFDSTKSIVNPSFEESDRYILNHLKYEEAFSEK